MNLAVAPTLRLSPPPSWADASDPMCDPMREVMRETKRETMRERTEVLHGLARGQVMTLEQPAGHEISCQRGRVQVMLDDGGPGTELGAGETLVPDSAARLRICALDDALVWSSSLGGIRAGVISSRR